MPMLSRHEREIFAAIASAALGTPVSASAFYGLDTFPSRMRSADRVQLQLLLRIMEYIAPALAGMPGRFTALSVSAALFVKSQP